MPKERIGPPGTNTGIVLPPVAKCLVCWYSKRLALLLVAGREPVFYTFQAERLRKELKQAQPNQNQHRQALRAIQ